MKFKTETIEEKQKILIVSDIHHSLVSILKSELKKYDSSLFFSSKLPKNTEKFDLCFIINNEKRIENIGSKQKIIYIFLNEKKHIDSFSEKNFLPKTKVIHIEGDVLEKHNIDKILWFSLSQTKEQFLRFSVRKRNKRKTVASKKHKIDLPQITFKSSFIVLIVIFLLSQIIFILPLSIASYSYYQAVILLKNENIEKAESKTIIGNNSLSLAKQYYSFSRPTLLLFSLALFPDNIFEINEITKRVIEQSIGLLKNTSQIMKLFLQKNKNPEEKQMLILRLDKVKITTKQLEKDVLILYNKLPSQIFGMQKIKKQMNTVIEMLSKGNSILSHTDTLLAKGTKKEYLLLFANNMELRPGGGFIGSFGIVTIQDYTMEKIDIYDVYDADGQLKIHINPPDPIRDYLQQPHWFLRDSAFSPDFLENYAQAKFFLEKEMKFSGFSGAILITTSAIQNILEAFGNIYLPDFNETINNKNFYLKAQIHAEKDFFPGSIQKKGFLSSLTKYLLLTIENASLPTLAKAFKQSLDEKQLVLYIDDPGTQAMFDSLYWSGRILEPKCTSSVLQDNCITDYLYPIDANLGVNKANFFIKRFMNIKTTINTNGTITHTFLITFTNESPGEIFPGGTYKNYFQIILPKDTKIKSITKNDVLVEEVTQKNEEIFKTVGFFLKIAPQEKSTITITYEIDQKIKKGKGIYQLIVQKQIGSSNNDFAFELQVPKNMFVINKNFSPLVKKNYILYNTTLSADKIFYIELIKE